MAFTTLAKVKERLRIPAADTTHDALIGSIIVAVENELLLFFQLDSDAVSSYTNTYDIEDVYTDGIWLVNYPVQSLTSVKFFGDTKDINGFYRSRPDTFGLMKRKSTSNSGELLYFPYGVQAVEVTHTAGFVDPSRDREVMCQAATLMAIMSFNIEQKAGFNSERIGQYAYHLAFSSGGPAGSGGTGSGTGMYPPPIERLLANYRRPFAPG